MENINIFIAVTATAVVVQAGILVAMYLAMRKTNARVEAFMGEVRTKVLPTVETAQAMLVDLRPRLDLVMGNVTESTTIVRHQLERLNATVNDIVDRVRLQVIRADELLTRTIDRVEETSDMVHKTVVSPVRQISGLMQGVTAGVEFFFSGKRRRSGDGMSVPQDEMFI